MLGMDLGLKHDRAAICLLAADPIAGLIKSSACNRFALKITAARLI